MRSIEILTTHSLAPYARTGVRRHCVLVARFAKQIEVSIRLKQQIASG